MPERILIAGAWRNGDPLPTNFGDPLFAALYGMQYGLEPKWVYSTFFVPKTVKPGQTFTAACLLENQGFDGCTTIKAFDGAKQVGSKFVGLTGGSYQAIEFEFTLTELGAHTITIGPMSGVVTVAQ
jgi:hypothetical protein